LRRSYHNASSVKYYGLGTSFLGTLEWMNTKTAVVHLAVQIMGVQRNRSQSCVTCGNTGFTEQARFERLAISIISCSVRSPV
jgi:hypothetical protein